MVLCCGCLPCALRYFTVVACPGITCLHARLPARLHARPPACPPACNSLAFPPLPPPSLCLLQQQAKLARYLDKEVQEGAAGGSGAAAPADGWIEMPEVDVDTTFVSKPIKPIILATGRAVCLYKVGMGAGAFARWECVGCLFVQCLGVGLSVQGGGGALCFCTVGAGLPVQGGSSGAKCMVGVRGGSGAACLCKAGAVPAGGDGCG